VAKPTINTSKVLLVFLAIFSAIFFGMASLTFVNMVNDHYIYLVAPIVGLFIALVFFYDRYIFFLLVILSRSSLDSAFNAIKFGNFGLGGVLNALIILIAILTLIEKPVKLQTDISGLKKAWIVYLGLAFISMFYAPSTVHSLKVFLILLSYASIFALGLHLVKTHEDFGKWIKAIALSSAIPVLYSLYSLAIGGGGLRLYRFEGLRLQGPFPHANTFSPYLALIIAVCFYLYKSKAEYISSSIRRLLPVYILILIGMLLMTKTRSAWVVTYLFFFFYAIVHERKFLILVIAVPLLALLSPDIQERIVDLTKGNDFGSTGYERLNSFAWRVKIWEDSINWMDKKRYLLGYGVSSFQQLSQKFAMANAFENQDFDINAHNIYVQTFFELGIVGLTALLYLLGKYFFKLVSLYRKNPLLLFTVIVIFIQFLLQSITDNLLDYLIVEWYMWFLIGITISKVSLDAASDKLVPQAQARAG
jgi:O-antigen ligase